LVELLVFRAVIPREFPVTTAITIIAETSSLLSSSTNTTTTPKITTEGE
jgi:hypothetical protein